jgi:hypothetical protein
MWVISLSEFAVGLYLVVCVIKVIETFARMNAYRRTFQLQNNEQYEQYTVEDFNPHSG